MGSTSAIAMYSPQWPRECGMGLKKDALLLLLQVADAQVHFGLAQAIGYICPRMPFCIVDRAPKVTHLPA